MRDLSSLIADEVEAAIAAGSAEKCSKTAAHIAALFLASAGSFSDMQIELFGGLFWHKAADHSLIADGRFRAKADMHCCVASTSSVTDDVWSKN